MKARILGRWVEYSAGVHRFRKGRLSVFDIRIDIRREISSSSPTLFTLGSAARLIASYSLEPPPSPPACLNLSLSFR